MVGPLERQHDRVRGEGLKLAIELVYILELSATDAHGVGEQVAGVVGDLLFDPLVQVLRGLDRFHVSQLLTGGLAS